MQFETIVTAINKFQSDFSVDALYYDDFKRAIVTERPTHANCFLLIERGQDIIPHAIVHDIAKHHLSQYHEIILERAANDPIEFDELFRFLDQECRIFYDAAKVLHKSIVEYPESFGLQKIMHQDKSLCFSPVK